MCDWSPSLAHDRSARRHPRGRQGHADEVRPAEGAAPAGRPAHHRARPPHGRSRSTRRRRRWSSGTAPTRCAPRSRRRPALQFVVQSPQLGTGHALLQTEPLLAGKKGTVLLLYADVPLLAVGHARAARRVASHDARRGDGAHGRARRSVRLRPHRPRRRRAHRAHRRGARRVGRGARDPAKSTAASTRSRSRRCSTSLHELATDNAQGEYYLTDLVAIYRRRNLRVETLLSRDARASCAASTAASISRS